MTTFRKTFNTPYEEHVDRHGQPFEVVREITEPDAEHDEECLPVYRIRFLDDVEIDAWPEEVVVGEYGTLVSSLERHEDALRHDATEFKFEKATAILAG